MKVLAALPHIVSLYREVKALAQLVDVGSGSGRA